MQKKLFRSYGKAHYGKLRLSQFNYQMLMQPWYLFTIKLDGEGLKSGDWGGGVAISSTFLHLAHMGLKSWLDRGKRAYD